MRTKEEILKDGKRIDMLQLEVSLDIRDLLRDILKTNKNSSLKRRVLEAKGSTKEKK